MVLGYPFPGSTMASMLHWGLGRPRIRASSIAKGTSILTGRVFQQPASAAITRGWRKAATTAAGNHNQLTCNCITNAALAAPGFGSSAVIPMVPDRLYLWRCAMHLVRKSVG